MKKNRQQSMLPVFFVLSSICNIALFQSLQKMPARHKPNHENNGKISVFKPFVPIANPIGTVALPIVTIALAIVPIGLPIVPIALAIVPVALLIISINKPAWVF